MVISLYIVNVKLTVCALSRTIESETCDSFWNLGNLITQNTISTLIEILYFSQISVIY